MMSDNEIIKALECCAQPNAICKECPCHDPYLKYPCADQLKWAALVLIEKQKAEIERFERENKQNFDKWQILDKRTKERYAELYEEAKGVVRAEAIKEFAERLKKHFETYADDEESNAIYMRNLIDDLVEEMTVKGGEADA